ncbi:Isoleucine--tRNA ligase (Ile-tRNA) [Candidatus Vidania fulgoroideae]|nr:Isoleucine--tRNA ligase (Ile-tRNA) [Candidatus Vidania fulgoroideae]
MYISMKKKNNNINVNKAVFLAKGNLLKEIKEINKKWKKEKVYEKILNEKKRKTIVLHDGPPYANGEIHLGHVINKVLKDIIIKKFFSLGYKVLYLPGWDCHGLPIEINVGKKKNINEYKKYALKQIKIQKKQFKKLGCIYDWKEKYKTMNPSLQSREIKFFIKLIKRKKVFVKKELVNFCTKCNSSLSDFEIEKRKKRIKLYWIIVSHKKKNIILSSFYKKISDFFIRNNTIFVRCNIDNKVFYVIKNELKMLNIKYFIDTKNLYIFKTKNVFKSNGEYIVLKGTKKVSIFSKKNIKKTTKICWRHKCNTIKKNKKQFFIDVKIKNKGILNSINFFPKETKKKFVQNVFKRPNWNISRRRTWGVPITLFKKGNNVIFYKKIIKLVKKYGIDSWKKISSKKKKYKKCKEILDVWFDSGTTHFTVLKNKKYNKRASFPSDIYIEGKDQHRGWFNASFITSFLVNKSSPFKNLITHGFAVDKTGKKMSKSKGNYLSVDKLIEEHNIEIIRLFISSSNFFKDISISNEKIAGIKNDYIKMRSIIKFCLQNIQDLKKESKRYLLIDRFILNELKVLITLSSKDDRSFNFFQSYIKIKNFMYKKLSNLYISSIKDRLYILRRNSPDRKSCQSTIKLVLREILILLSPYISYTAEEAWKNLGKNSIFFEKSKNFLIDIKSKEKAAIRKLITIKKKFDKIELGDKNQRILYILCSLHFNIIKQMESEIKFFFHNYKNIVIKSNKDKILLGKKVAHFKCEKCWNFVRKFYENKNCKRCSFLKKKKKIKERYFF